MPTAPRSPAKTTRPLVGEAFGRTRLWRRLDAARKHSIVWVVGPPGAGKTTAVATYVHARKLPALWYRVDVGDTDAAGLFHYLGLATAALGGRKKRSLPIWTSASHSTLRRFARRYFEELFERLPVGAVVVFDDYQEAPEDTAWSEALTEGLNAIPSGISVIVASRANPPAAFARRTAAGDLAIVGWGELRLSRDEATGIANRRAPVRQRPGAAAISRLYDLADGWAAGLVLLLGRAHGAEGVLPGGIDHVSQDVFDYLAAELFERTDASTQRFLLETSFFPSFTEQIVEASAGDAARRILTRLRREDFLVERQYGPEASYRYHPLFRAFLIDRATRALSASELAAARQRAAALLIDNGQPEHAFSLLKGGKDEEGMKALVLREAPALLATARRRTLEAWIDNLSNATVANDGWLSVWKGVCLLGHAPTSSASHFTRAFELLAAAEDPIGMRVAWSGAVQAIFLEGVDFRQIDPWLQRLDDSAMSRPLAPLMPDLALRMATAELLAFEARRPGMPETRAAADRAFALCQRASDLGELVMTGALLVMHHAFFEGDAGRAAVVLEVMRAAHRKHAGEPLVRVTVELAEAVYGFTHGDTAGSLAAATLGMRIADEAGIDVWNDRLSAIAVSAALSLGDLAAARKHLATMALTLGKGGRFNEGNYRFHAAWEAFLRGDIRDAVQNTSLSLACSDDMDFPLPRTFARTAMGTLEAEAKRFDSADTWFCEARDLATTTGNRFQLFACLLVQADLAARRGDEPQARTLLARGFALGREAGCFNMFCEPPGMFARLAERALRGGIEVDYARELVRRRHLRPERAPVDIEAWPWRVRIHTLGRFGIEIDGEALEFSRKAQRSPLGLLKATIALGGQQVPKQRLIAALWPDAEGDAGNNAFDTTLHRLRKLIGADALRLVDLRLALDPNTVWTDVRAVEALLSDLDSALSKDVELSASILERILQICRGPFLGGTDDEPWAFALRRRLQERVVRAVLRVGERVEAGGAMDRAVGFYQSGIFIDDTAEPLHQRVISSYLRQGRRAEARRAYEHCMNVIASTLGAEPAEETRALGRTCSSNE